MPRFNANMTNDTFLPSTHFAVAAAVVFTTSHLLQIFSYLRTLCVCVRKLVIIGNIVNVRSVKRLDMI